MSGTNTKTKQTKKSTKSVSRKQRPSSKTGLPESRKTKTNPKSQGKSSSGTPSKTGNFSLSSLRKTKAKTSESSQQESSTKTKKDAWDGYDFEEMPPLTDKQLGTFKSISKQDFEKLSRGRPRKSPEEKFQSITVRFEPNLLKEVKQKAVESGLAWQSYLKILVKSGLENTKEQRRAR
jgi:predicted DNA binding CopG/RHH family protein